jgi:hypothetical protein
MESRIVPGSQDKRFALILAFSLRERIKVRGWKPGEFPRRKVQ